LYLQHGAISLADILLFLFLMRVRYAEIRLSCCRFVPSAGCLLSVLTNRIPEFNLDQRSMENRLWRNENFRRIFSGEQAMLNQIIYAPEFFDVRTIEDFKRNLEFLNQYLRNLRFLHRVQNDQGVQAEFKRFEARFTEYYRHELSLFDPSRGEDWKMQHA